MNEQGQAAFTGLVDLAAASLGGEALGANDEFFAEASNLLLPGRGVFIEGKFTGRGKWMDGWESRRKRAVGFDSCIVRLGAPGTLVGFDIDTHFFVGNHPPFASVEGLLAPADTTLEALDRMSWTELLAQAPLRPDSQNLFGALPSAPVSHLRLNIFPDGGVARFRAYGTVRPPPEGAIGEAEVDDETRKYLTPGLLDLAAVKSGGLALACSDAFFSPMNNLLLPGRAENMGGGWETRRRRGPGHDWILVKLAARCTPRVLEIDTNHFKGNFPDRASVDVLDASSLPRARITDLIASTAWLPLLRERKLEAHTRHFFTGEDLAPCPQVTHLRLNVFPDGGVSRLRAWGAR